MNKLRTIINKFSVQQDESLLNAYRFLHNGKQGYGVSFDVNYWARKDLIFELYKSYGATDKPLIKWLLQEEGKGFEVAIPVYTSDVCAFMLYKHMEMHDIYDLFEAKFGFGSDHQFTIDVELVFGFGRNETKAFLLKESKNKELNTEILAMIQHYEANPNAQFKDRSTYIRYFETKKINIIKSDLSNIEENRNH